jgi:predicted transcriptional regulator
MRKKQMYNTTIDTDLTKEIRILAAQLDKRQNNLIEEAIQDLIKKYKNDNTKESQLDFLVSEIIQKNHHFF